jgi:hypothetical protein
LEVEMTRKEITGHRDLSFSRWVRENLPESKSGFMVTDVDFFIYNYKTKKVAIVEVKTHESNIKTWQKIFYKNLVKWIKTGCQQTGWKFMGIYLIQFQNTCFDDGWCKVNNDFKTQEEVIEILSI